MAIQIQTSSDVKTVGISTKYTNSPDFGSELHFKDNVEKYHYFLLGKDYSGNVVVLQTGVLQGFKYNASSYGYRFDFKNLINILNQESPVLTKVLNLDVWTQYSTRESEITLFISTNPNLIQENIDAQNLFEANGKIYDEGATTYNNYIADYYFQVKFVDGQDNRGYSTSHSVRPGKLVTATIFSGWKLLKVQFMISGGVLGDINLNAQQVNNDKMFKTFFIEVPNNDLITGVQLEFNKVGSPSEWVFIPTIIGCGYTYYYLNSDGVLSTLNCGNRRNIIENIEKKYLNINGKKIVKDIIVTKQIKQNTGFNLKADEIYDLYKTPYVYTLNGDMSTKRYNIDNSTFEGYNGLKLSEKNIELILSEESNHKRLTNKQINFFD